MNARAVPRGLPHRRGQRRVQTGLISLLEQDDEQHRLAALHGQTEPAPDPDGLL